MPAGLSSFNCTETFELVHPAREGNLKTPLFLDSCATQLYSDAQTPLHCCWFFHCNDECYIAVVFGPSEWRDCPCLSSRGLGVNSVESRVRNLDSLSQPQFARQNCGLRLKVHRKSYGALAIAMLSARYFRKPFSPFDTD